MSKKWLFFHSARPSSLARLFCFPFAGGNASTYRTLATRLSPKIEVCPIQLPGRANRFNEPAFTRAGDLVGAMERDLAPLFDKPFAFFGYSLGAVLAYELARALLSKRGLEPCHLLVAARRGPQVPLPHPPIYALPDAPFLAAVKELSGTPHEVAENPELMALAMPLLRADFEVSETHVQGPGPTLRCPVTALVGLEDREVTATLAEPWREVTTGAFKLLSCPGNHFFIHTHETFVVEAIEAALAPVLSGGGRGFPARGAPG